VSGNTRSALTQEERERFEGVFRYQFHLRKAQAFVNVDLDNIEDLFGVIDLDERVGQPRAQKVREDLVFLIVRTLELTILPRSGVPTVTGGTVDMSRNTWERFAEVVARLPVAPGDRRASLVQEPDAIITFNYDTLLDTAMVAVGVRPAYCLAKGEDRRTFSADKKKIRLLKLHGSAGWSHCTMCGDDRVYVFDDFRSSLGKTCGPQSHAPMAPLIVPPTWDKGASRSHLATVWKAAWDELRTAQRLFIIGYSAPPSDRHFRYFLASALANNYDLTEVVVVSDAAGREKAKETYDALFAGAAAQHRVSFPKTHGFEDFVNYHLWNHVGREG
jgi:SIR2-like protein